MFLLPILIDMYSRIWSLSIGILLSLSVCAQYDPSGGIYPDAVFSETIKTVRLYKADWETSYPIGRIEDEMPLELTFDELSKTARNYSYTIVHCDADWRQSRLIPSDYMDGFTVNQIRDYKYSFNTLIPYVHYRISIPNEDVLLKVSGNFVVLVFEDSKDDRPILCKRFCITESMVAVSAVAIRARQTALQDEWQQIDFTVNTANYPVENAYQDVKVTIIQNGQWHTALTGIRPLFVRQNELDYRQEKANLFRAGNEFRPLDTKSTRFTSTRMTAIEFKQPTYHFYPYADESRNAGRYLFYEDFNGKYAIQSEKTNQPNIEADYVYVHFTLRSPQPLDNGQVYVAGAFCNDACTPENLMTYNAGNGHYEATILLKQGYYNYKYVFLPFKNPAIDDTKLEGSFNDTENDYIICVYHRGRSSRYDRLVGVSVVNTMRR